MPAYHAESADIDRDFNELQWWKLHATTLPCKNMILIQPLSADAETVFSLLKVTFGELQDAALQDNIEVSIMLQYNKRSFFCHFIELIVTSFHCNF